VIPPGTKLQETVFPVDHVQQVGGKWTQTPLLPEVVALNETAKQFTGKEVRLFLRLLINDKRENVTLTFKIANMVQ
jgi:hypothetical protein